MSMQVEASKQSGKRQVLGLEETKTDDEDRTLMKGKAKHEVNKVVKEVRTMEGTLARGDRTRKARNGVTGLDGQNTGILVSTRHLKPSK